jgi:hypothetical protein
MPAAALLLEQFSQGHGTEFGWPPLIGFLIVLLVGGIALLIQAVVDFRRDREVTKRELEEGRDKRKAA